MKRCRKINYRQRAHLGSMGRKRVTRRSGVGRRRAGHWGGQREETTQLD
jgi:hypothetical protein